MGKWRQEVFKNGGDIYCVSASQMFGVPVGALKAMGAIEMGLAEDELQPLVNSWRDSNYYITELW